MKKNKSIKKITSKLVTEFIRAYIEECKAYDRYTSYQHSIAGTSIRFDETSISYQSSASFWHGRVDGIEAMMHIFYS